MRRSLAPAAVLLAATFAPSRAQSAVVPPEVQLPGTQPGEVSELESPNKCDNCHGGYDQAVEPAFNWRGSMMAQATRDPLFWATVAVAEQDFPGAGDLCLRCHTTEGWLGQRSTPTDGSALKESDATGVMCDACHQVVDPTGLELPGVQNAPFLAHDEGAPPTGYHGSGMYVLSPVGNAKVGPLANPDSPHPFLQADFHRDSAFCGTCHDVSNPAVGDLAHNNGAMTPLAPGTFSGSLGGPVADKAAFNNFPYQYGIVERTFSEHAIGLLSQLSMDDYDTLPADLQAGSIEAAYLAANAGVLTGDYVDGTTRFFTCQSCHMSPVNGKACDKNNAPVRPDLPLHDMTGGNTWTPDAIAWLDGQGKLVLGGGLSANELAAMQAGKQRALQNLQLAAGLDVTGDLVKVTNLTGHKLISGFPEGRRMWLRVVWRDCAGQVIEEDGEYGATTVTHRGGPLVVETLLDPKGTRVWEAHPGMTQEWASQLLGLGYPAGLALAFDPADGSVEATLGDLAAQPPGTVWATLHFVLNNALEKDTRIPPYGMGYDDALARNVLPVPATQYGDPGPGGTYRYWDEVLLDPPDDAATADVELLYQTTSWEYVQFLELANTGAVASLASTGADVVDAWLATGMAAPVVMATATWTDADLDGNLVPDACDPLSVDTDEISLAAGGAQAFDLNAGPAQAFALYWLLGTTTGTTPGQTVGSLTLPLNFSSFFLFTVLNPNLLVPDSLAFLDAGGEKELTLALPPGLDPALAGITFHHAYLLLDAVTLKATFASNAVPLRLVL